jgi:hypothetical protein
LEKTVQVKHAIAASFEDFDLVIETFNKAAVMAVDEVVSDLVEMMIEGRQKSIKTSQASLLNVLTPMVRTLFKFVE